MGKFSTTCVFSPLPPAIILFVFTRSLGTLRPKTYKRNTEVRQSTDI